MRGLFGMPAGIAYGMGQAMKPQAPQVPQMAAQKPEKAFMDTTAGKLASIGQILLSRGRQNPMMQYRMQQQMMQQQARARQQAAEAARMAAREDKMWEWQNKPQDAPKPYRWRNNNGDLMELGADGNPRVAYDDPTDKINWIQVKDPATGALQIVPMGPSGMMGGNAAPDTLPADFFD